MQRIPLQELENEDGNMRHFIQVSLITLATVVGVCAAESCAKADPGAPDCETIPWGFLGSQARTICDGPVLNDGSWQRARVIWVPAHQVPLICTHSSYSSYCSGGYFVDAKVVDTDRYPVNPNTVLPDEPGHLPIGAATVA
jgi:hypothetical protein